MEYLLPSCGAGPSVVGSEPTAVFALKIHYPDYLAGEDAPSSPTPAKTLGEFLLRYRADYPDEAPLAGSSVRQTARRCASPITCPATSRRSW